LKDTVDHQQLKEDGEATATECGTEESPIEIASDDGNDLSQYRSIGTLPMPLKEIATLKPAERQRLR
jgi:hypothetical protein